MNQCVCTHSSDHLGLTQEAVEDWGRACEEENEVLCVCNSLQRWLSGLIDKL